MCSLSAITPRWRGTLRNCCRLVSGGPKRRKQSPKYPFSGFESKGVPDPRTAGVAKDRPFTLPPGIFRPKQSLGQNFLSDQNFVRKIVNAFAPLHEGEMGERVVEIGSGTGALTRVLLPKYPKMTALEIDPRSVKFLLSKLPSLHCVHGNVLDTNWCALAAMHRGPLNIIGNLPYNVTSQILFNLVDNYRCLNKVVITAQWEVRRSLFPPNPSVCVSCLIHSSHSCLFLPCSSPSAFWQSQTPRPTESPALSSSSTAPPLPAGSAELFL